MTLPAKVIGFLDITGHWDPTLAFVMLGAVAVTGVFFPMILKWRKPLLDKSFDLPTKTAVDRPLLLGSALFGAGWGLAGYCPGPAITSVASGSLKVLVFVATMFAGFALAKK
jgi:hypothetical protein